MALLLWALRSFPGLELQLCPEAPSPAWVLSRETQRWKVTLHKSYVYSPCSLQGRPSPHY